jgi:hypothetical protein
MIAESELRDRLFVLFLSVLLFTAHLSPLASHCLRPVIFMLLSILPGFGPQHTLFLYRVAL